MSSSQVNPSRINLRQVIGRIGLWLSVFVIVSPAILFCLGMASVALGFGGEKAAYPAGVSPDRSAW